jgi:hypothetical protein
MISDTIHILVKADAHSEICFDLTSQLGLLASTLNMNVKSHEETERGYTQSGTFFKKCTSLKYSPLEELEFALTARYVQATLPQMET